MRVRLDLGYDGTDFAGWAAQPGQRTVQGTLTAALATVLRADPAALDLVVAGRTDAGVHARGQVCHVDVPQASWGALPGRSTRTPALARCAGWRACCPRTSGCARRGWPRPGSTPGSPRCTGATPTG